MEIFGIDLTFWQPTIINLHPLNVLFLSSKISFPSSSKRTKNSFPFSLRTPCPTFEFQIKKCGALKNEFTSKSVGIVSFEGVFCILERSHENWSFWIS